MEISRVNNNTSFGLFYNFLSERHNQFLHPVMGRLARIGKHADIIARTTVAPEVIGKDYIISSECIEIVAKPKDKLVPSSETRRIFTNQYHEKVASPAQRKAGREAVVRSAYDAAKKAIMTSYSAEKQFANSYYDVVEGIRKPLDTIG